MMCNPELEECIEIFRGTFPEPLSKSQRVEVLGCVDRLWKDVPKLRGFDRERVLMKGANGRGAIFARGGTFALTPRRSDS